MNLVVNEKGVLIEMCDDGIDLLGDLRGNTCNHINAAPAPVARSHQRKASEEKDVVIPMKAGGRVVPGDGSCSMLAGEEGRCETQIDPAYRPSGPTERSKPGIWVVRSAKTGHVVGAGTQKGHDRSWLLAKDWADTNLGRTETTDNGPMKWVLSEAGKTHSPQLEIDPQSSVF